ncbi:pre-B-cell leukemia transcription factor-interacting protein 1 [Hyaena hyaena]|uniref:pre-B-cell leukemia transcription factor-interacting protein 1 n=1 Tax=Hyaena hyaena TaxID=95912 RepID=UPI001922EAE7|nr:pre-B-cell leukemia transcription factor-interacting protein 1 [Hyaena hyaena]
MGAAAAASGTPATMASCPDSDNSWVLAGSEGLPVETLGPGCSTDPEDESAPQAPWSCAEAAAVGGEGTPFQSESSQCGPILPEKTEAKGVPEGDGSATKPPGPGDTLVQGDSEEAPVVAGLEDARDPECHSPPQSLPSSPSAAWPAEEARRSSSEDDTDVDVDVDVGGLRRRRGREPSTPLPTAALGVEGQARGEGAGGELGISLNKCLVWALALLGLGSLLLLSGGLPESDSGPAEEAQLQVFPDAVLDVEDGLGQGLQASAPPDGVPGLQNMALLLDKLARENQDIRLLQAQLQVGTRGCLPLWPQGSRLCLPPASVPSSPWRADRARGPDGACVGGARGSPAGGVPGEQRALKRELGRQRQDLEQSLRGAGRGALETGGQRPGAAANASEARRPEPRAQSASERSGKEARREGQGDRKAEPGKYGKGGTGGERRKGRGGEDREAAGGWGEGEPGGAQWGSRKDAKRPGPKEPPRKSGGPHPSVERQKHPQRREGANEGRDPPAPWAELSRRRYRAPQGCAGVRECARQEGLAFGVELAPVRLQELASLLTAYLARLPWAGPLSQELPLSPAYFGEDGIFRHDRLRFRDFVDALEDSLEEAAVRQTGDDDEVDDFEGFIFSHFFGDKALKKRSGKKDRHFRSPGRG